jgi:hypothetical protein
MRGEDISQVLPIEADDIDELAEDIRGFRQMTREELDRMFYSCLRGYGWKG